VKGPAWRSFDITELHRHQALPATDQREGGAVQPLAWSVITHWIFGSALTSRNPAGPTSRRRAGPCLGVPEIITWGPSIPSHREGLPDCPSREDSWPSRTQWFASGAVATDGVYMQNSDLDECATNAPRMEDGGWRLW